MTKYEPNSIAVIFCAKRNDNDTTGYDKAALAMSKLAQQQKGFISMENARDDKGYGITISYWENDAAAKSWRDNEQHRIIRDKGRAIWYDEYSLQVATIDRSYDWQRDE